MGKGVQYNIVDYCKFLFALCIVGIHTNTLSDTIVYPLLFRIAVPYFFIASGFFIGNKLYDVGIEEFKWGVIKRLLTKLIVFEPISIVLISIQLYRQGLQCHDMLTEITQHILFYPYGALWYIQALIVALLICVPLLKYLRIKWILLGSFLLYLFALLCNNYYFLSKILNIDKFIDNYLEIFVSPRNGIFVGLLYVSSGIAIAKYKNILQSLKPQFLFLTIILFGVLLFEANCLKYQEFADDRGLFLTYVFYVPSLFICTASWYGNSLPLASLLRKLSISIYLLHQPILMVLISVSVNIFGDRVTPYWAFMITTLISISISLFVYRHKQSVIYKWLT